MLAGILSAIDRNDLIEILRVMAYGMYQKPPLSDDERKFLQNIVQFFNIDDYEEERIFSIDVRHELDITTITSDMSYSSTKGLLFLLEVTSGVLNDKPLKAFTKEKVLPNLPFSAQINRDLIVLASEYIEIASEVYNFIWKIEKTGRVWKTVEVDIDPYQKLFFIDDEKMNQISIDEKKGFFRILTYLMLDDAELDDAEKESLSTLSYLLGIKYDTLDDVESCRELNISELTSLSEMWFKRLLIFTFLFSRAGKLKGCQFERLNMMLSGFGVTPEDFELFVGNMDLFKENYMKIVEAIQSKEISGPNDEKGAEYAKHGLSVLSAAVSFIPVVGPSLALAQKISRVSGDIVDRRSGGMMDFGLTDIHKDSENKTLVICIDGFMSELSDGQFSDWKQSLESMALSAWVKGFKWPSSALGTLLKSGGSAWYEAVSNTAKAGERLANDIDVVYGFRPDVKIVLMGHSLGSRVIFNTLTRLNAMGQKVHEVYLLGGAVTRTDKAQWLAALNAVEHRAYNFYSSNDDILKKLYQSTMMGDSPAGLGSIEYFRSKEFSPAELINIDSTNLIGGHTEYKDKLPQLINLENHDFGLMFK